MEHHFQPQDSEHSILGRVRHRYHGLQSLLGENSHLLEIMADLEADLRFLPLGSESLQYQVRALLQGTLLMIEDLNWLAGDRFQSLYPSYRRIERKVGEILKGSIQERAPRWAMNLAEVGLGHMTVVGGKAARLGELKKVLAEAVPDGFVVTADAYQRWMGEALLSSEIRGLLETLEVSADPARFRSKAARIREIILHAPLPEPVRESIQRMASVIGTASEKWAVRSSAVGEDGSLSFAGQFESVLNVPGSHLREAYKKVVASRFADRAISYRLSGGFTEAATPMAVLFIPIIEPKSAGVLYTQDPNHPESEQILISSTWGLAGDLVGGQAPADMFWVSRQEPLRVRDSKIALKRMRLLPGEPLQTTRVDNSGKDQDTPSLSEDEARRLSGIGLFLERHFAGPQDIEWAIDHQGKIWILQARPLRLIASCDVPGPVGNQEPILSGGLTIFPGRAIAPVQVVKHPGEFSHVSQGVILVVPQATPELASLLPKLAGFIAEQGHPTGHAATLLREFAVPSIFDLPGATYKLTSGMLVGLDAGHRQVFPGAPWPDIQERTLNRMAKPRTRGTASPLEDLILSLRMTDPQSRNFRPENCESVHDLIRFVHEKGVATFFEIGDHEARRRGTATRKLATSIPLNILVQDLGSALTSEATKKKEVAPGEIRSTPFQALWTGISDPRVRWAGRSQINLKGFAAVMASSLGQEMGAMRRLGDPNYLLVGADYMNLNIRLAYHYAMVDSLVGPVTENNYVNFRFRGGGGSQQRLDLRARFLSEILLRNRFMVDQRGDLVTAWLRRYPQHPCGEALALLGKLMGCARQLDMLMEDESAMLHFVELFSAGKYDAFA